MPEFMHLRLVRPAGQLFEYGSTPNRLALAILVGKPISDMPPPVGATGDVASLSEAQATGYMAVPSTAVSRFLADYCIPPVQGFASAADLALWNTQHPWCSPLTGPITPNRIALRARLGVPSLPSIAVLSEALAGTISNADYYTQFCGPIVDSDGTVRYSPWCGPDYHPLPPPPPPGRRAALQALLGHVLPPIDVLSERQAAAILEDSNPTQNYKDMYCTPPNAEPWCVLTVPPSCMARLTAFLVANPTYVLPLPAGISALGRAAFVTANPTCGLDPAMPWVIVPPVLPTLPLIPGYAAGRVAPMTHYITWAGAPFAIGGEKSFLLGLPPDDYYRLVDKFAQGGPAGLHQATRIEATRRGVADPLATAVNLDATIAQQQVDWQRGIVQTTPPRRNLLVPALVVTGIAGALWYFWPKKK